MSDLTMVRRELIIGYTVAGFLAVLVPTSVWQAVFVTGHGFWTSLENAVVGPFIAIISFVCSIGNVPLAASLWKGGIAFGGVIVFIFADLITFPLLLIYRRYYGTRLMLQDAGGLLGSHVDRRARHRSIFRGAGLVPTMRPVSVAPAHFSWNYTTYLNLIFLVVFGVLYWIYRNRERFGAGTGTRGTPCAECRWSVAHAPGSSLGRCGSGAERQYFCSDRVRERERLLNHTRRARHETHGSGSRCGGRQKKGNDETCVQLLRSRPRAVQGRYSPVPMPDYDAIVIGAGHNGLTAAAVMARGGMRVLCLEKNHFIGGMASTTELIRGYRFELAGSIQFPVPNEIYEDLDLASCPIYEPEVQSASITDDGRPPIFLYSDPERLLEHLGETLGIEAVLGMAEVAAWAEAPARAIGRFDVRKPPKSLDEMWASATNEAEREAIRAAMFGSVMDVVDRYLPDKTKHAPVRSMLSFLSVNSTFRGPYSPGSALCLAFALASPGGATMSKVRGGLGTIADHLCRLFEQHGGELRRHVKAAGIVVERGAVKGVDLGDGEIATAPVVVSNLDPTATFTQLMEPDALPEAFVRRVTAIDHRAAYFQAHFALRGLPEYRGPYEALNGGDFGRNVTFFGTAEQMQQDFEGCVRGQVPGPRASTCRSPRSTTRAWPRTACTRRAALRSTCRSVPTARRRAACGTKWRNGSWTRSLRSPRTFPTWSTAS